MTIGDRIKRTGIDGGNGSGGAGIHSTRDSNLEFSVDRHKIQERSPPRAPPRITTQAHSARKQFRDARNDRSLPISFWPSRQTVSRIPPSSAAVAAPANRTNPEYSRTGSVSAP